MGYEIKLADIFEGPLDLLLFLIKKNKIDIYNIPIALITEQYLQYLEIMRSLNLDLAGEYLVLAATLIHIKSRMLLPPDNDEVSEEESDPRKELVQQLLEYQAYKDASIKLDGRLLLERDIFKRGAVNQDISNTDDADERIELNLFDLVAAFQKIVSSMDKNELLEINSEKISLADRINEIMERLSKERNMVFTDLLDGLTDKRKIIYTLLAILELMKLQMIKAYQSGPFSVIRIFIAVDDVFTEPIENITIQ